MRKNDQNNRKKKLKDFHADSNRTKQTYPHPPSTSVIVFLIAEN